MTPKPQKIEGGKEDLREKLLREYTEFYFIHCKPEQKPEFKKLDEAENWYKHQDFKINSIVRNQVDSTMVIISDLLASERQRCVEEAKKRSINNLWKRNRL